MTHSYTHTYTNHVHKYNDKRIFLHIVFLLPDCLPRSWICTNTQTLTIYVKKIFLLLLLLSYDIDISLSEGIKIKRRNEQNKKKITIEYNPTGIISYHIVRNCVVVSSLSSSSTTMIIKKNRSALMKRAREWVSANTMNFANDYSDTTKIIPN